MINIIKKQRKKIFPALILGLLIAGLFCSVSICLADNEVIEVPEPLGNRDIPAIVADVIKYALGFVGVITLVMFIIGGITWMTSGGSAERIKKGKDTIVWAIFGLAFIFFSYSILEFILKALIKK